MNLFIVRQIGRGEQWTWIQALGSDSEPALKLLFYLVSIVIFDKW